MILGMFTFLINISTRNVIMQDLFGQKRKFCEDK